MNKKDFLKQYQSQWWLETSKRIKARDHNTCQMCGCNDKPLSVHHLYYGEDGSIKVPDSSLITLCEDCHLEQEDYKELCQQSIKELREQLTAFEIYNILEDVKNENTLYTNKPIWERNVSPTIKPRRFILEEDEEKMKKLSSWRNGVLKKELVDIAVHEYLLSKKCKFNREDLIEEWFFDNYGYRITDYMAKNKDVVNFIEKKVNETIKKYGYEAI